MSKTLFGLTIVIGAVVGLFGTLESGDGLEQPLPEELSARHAALTRARVFLAETPDVSRVDFSVDPNAHVADPDLTTCRYEPDEVSGTTPKFDCVLPSGEKIKVKYGWTREIPSETAATRLLTAMGFGADRVSRVKTVRCFGCPFQPFHLRSLAELLQLDGYLDGRLDYENSREFHNVSIERNLEGEAIEAGPERGWGFFELDRIDASRGGATRADVDALRLMAVFLHHWDNKTANQRLLCEGAEDANCRHPLAMLQDVGASFGPPKMSLENWRRRPVWADPATCRVSMEDLPYGGGTFVDVAISEQGRQLLGGRLSQMRAAQIDALFVSAGFERVSEWRTAFEDKVRQITARPPCPGPARQHPSTS